jgi:hypothetical protein
MTYLKGVGKPMATVRAALRSNPVLKQLLTTPRWLSLVILTYRDKAIRDLPQLGTAEQQKQHILERYVERMLEQRTTKGHFVSKQARRWLVWLAQQMQKHSQTEFFLEQMHPRVAQRAAPIKRNGSRPSFIEFALSALERKSRNCF